MRDISRVLFLIAPLLLALSCIRSVEITPEEVVAQVESGLSVDASREEIESSLMAAGMPYSFDRFQKRYQGILRDPDSGFHAIVVHVYLDPNEKFLRVEAHGSFTAP